LDPLSPLSLPPLMCVWTVLLDCDCRLIESTLQDIRESAGALDSVPFKAIAAGKASLVDAVKEMNPIAAAIGILGSMRYAFPDLYSKITSMLKFD
jgi:hypothetical protein